MEDIGETIDKAIGLRREGKEKESLDLLQKKEEEIIIMPEHSLTLISLGEIHYCQGITLQTMGKHDEAIDVLLKATIETKNCPMRYARSMFQLFVAKIYAKISISPEEIERTKTTLRKMIASSINPWVSGDCYQKLAYIELKQNNINEAISLYIEAKKYRKEAENHRGLAVTRTRIGECYKKLGDNEKAKKYGQKALEYFKKVGDRRRIKKTKERCF